MNGHSTIAILTGPKRSGKSFTAKQIAEAHPRVLICDPAGDGYADVPGIVQVKSEDDFIEATEANSREDYFAIVFCPSFGIEGASELVADIGFEIGDCLILLDEAHNFMGANWMGENVGRLIRQSRHANCNVVLASPRLADLNTNARFQADVWIVCGSLWTERDATVVEAHCGPEFCRACQQPIANPEHEFRRLGFDTRTREQFVVTETKLARLFRLPTREQYQYKMSRKAVQ